MSSPVSGSQNGDGLHLRSFHETDFQEVELVWTKIQPTGNKMSNLDDLSLQTFHTEDFLCDEEAEDQEKCPLDEALECVGEEAQLSCLSNGVMAEKALDLLPSSSPPQELSEPSKSTNVFPAWYLQADKDLEALYNILDTTSPSVFTLDMMDELETEIKDLHVLMQLTKEKLGKSRKKAEAKMTLQEAQENQEKGHVEEKKKRKNLGKRFLQWLNSKMSCCSCVDVRW